MKVTLDSHGSMYISVRDAPEGVTLVTDVITDECNIDKLPMSGEIIGIELLNVDLNVDLNVIHEPLPDLRKIS